MALLSPVGKLQPVPYLRSSKSQSETQSLSLSLNSIEKHFLSRPLSQHLFGTHLKIRMISCRVCVLAALFSLLIITLIPTTQSADCCLKFTQRPVHCRLLKGYTFQDITSSCDLNAVIFQNRRNKFVCADPSIDWTKRVLRCLRKRQEKKSQLKKRV